MRESEAKGVVGGRVRMMVLVVGGGGVGVAGGKRILEPREQRERIKKKWHFLLTPGGTNSSFLSYDLWNDHFFMWWLWVDTHYRLGAAVDMSVLLVWTKAFCMRFWPLIVLSHLKCFSRMGSRNQLFMSCISHLQIFMDLNHCLHAVCDAHLFFSLDEENQE